MNSYATKFIIYFACKYQFFGYFCVVAYYIIVKLMFSFVKD